MKVKYLDLAENYLDAYWRVNKKDIKRRLVFLLGEFEGMPDYAGPADIWYYFEEARHTFMMGDFIGSIILSVCAIELWMAYLLRIPYYQSRGTIEEFDEFTFGKLVKSCVSKKIISDREEKALVKLNNLRTFYVHGKDVFEDSGNKRESKEKSKFWGSKILQSHFRVKSIEQDAQYAIRTLFYFYRNHHYSKQL